MAIVTVVVLLAALMLIAAPFALSMRRMESGALFAADQEAARAGALAALAAAERHLEDTHPHFDITTPHVDTLGELAPDDLGERFAGQLDRNPRGAVRSVRVEDEQGKVHLPTASVFLLGNLFGGRTTLIADAGELDDRLDVVSTAGFPPSGLLWVGHELVEYSAREPTGFAETRRGQVDASLPTSRARSHRRGADVFDLRVAALAQHGWRHRPGVFDVFRRVDAIKDVGLYAPMTYTAAEVEAVRDLVTVHGAPVAWRDRAPVRAVGTSPRLASTLVVDDASRWGAGTVLRVTSSDGATDWALVDRSHPWDGRWRVELFGVLLHDHDDRSVVDALRREPVNVATAPAPVLEALLAGVGRHPVAHVVDPAAAAQLAVSLPRDASLGLPAVLAVLESLLEAGRLVEADVSAAWDAVQRDGLRLEALTPQELGPLLVGLETRRPSLRVTPDAARRVAARIAAQRPTGPSELRTLLDAAVAAGDLSPLQHEALLRNATDPGDAWLIGGTAPFTYASGGTFTLAAAASENLPTGRERARAHVRRVTTVAPGGETLHRFATQRDLEAGLAAGPGGSGWTTFPTLLEVGGAPRSTALAARADAPSPLRADADAVVVPSVALDPRRDPPSRPRAVVAGLPGPSSEEDASALAPRPVRSTLPDTLHFDEGVDGLVGSSPAGFSFRDQGSITFTPDAVEPRIVSSIGRLERFTIEFWFECREVPEGDAVLFDGGLGELEDRVLIALLDGELVLRVHDASLPDFEADVGEQGLVPPTGEIRYAFDDGLDLLPGVPYHVLAEIGGAGPRDLSLWVDGVPRGRRSFHTFLTADVEAAGASGTLLAGNSERLPVDSTAGFPRQGVLDVGHELIEYIDVEDDAFVVSPLDDGDPFGGRARRRSLPAEHPAGTAVTLAGYSLPLASDVANRGNATLESALGEFGVAMLDANRLDDTISAQVLTNAPGAAPIEIVLGKGLRSTATSIPVTAAGSANLSNDTFSASGGHAMIVAVHDAYALTLDLPGGATGETFRFPQETIDGDAIDGVEIIRYTGFDGQTLSGCQRHGAGIPSAFGGPASDLVGGGFSVGGLSFGTNFDDRRAFVAEYDGALTSGGLIPDRPRVLVVPLSVPVAAPYDDYAPRPDSAADRSALAQVGLDFGVDDPTEWVRWNTATQDSLVRDDEDAIDATIARIDQLDAWNPDVSSFNDDAVDQIGEALDLRGQVGTTDSRHASGAQVLPTHMFGGWGIAHASMAQRGYGAPGRLDAITLVGVQRGEAGEIVTVKEWHRINHAAIDDRDGATDGLPEAWLVGLRDPVVGEFLRTDPLDRDNYGVEDGQVDAVLDPESTAYDSVTALAADVRLVTRIIKAPSRELPTGPIATFALGRDFAGRRTEADVVVDELRIATRRAPDDLVPTTATFLLAEELEDDERRELRVDLSGLRYPHRLVRDPVLGPDGLAAAALLPEDGGLLRVGDEIMSYAGFDAVDSGTVYLTGRGLYGTRPQAHPAAAPVEPLVAWPASPLAARATAESAVVPLVDASGFPPGPGLVLIGDELVGYTDVGARSLSMPHSGGGVTTIGRRGLLRGRHGTRAAEHEAGALVRWMPMRHRDAGLLGTGHASAEHAALTVHAPGAFLTDLAIAATIPAPGARLDVRAVFDRAASHHAQAAAGVPLVALSSQGFGDVVVAGPLARQADVLDVHLVAGWDEGAFDPLRFASNGWKVVPRVGSVTAAHVQPTLVWEHEEWR